MAPQASENCGLLSPDHHRIGPRRSNGISLEEARGVFPVLHDLIPLSPCISTNRKMVPDTILIPRKMVPDTILIPNR